MVKEKLALKGKHSSPLWEDPRMKQLLDQSGEAPIDLSAFTTKEIKQIALDGLGAYPGTPRPPKLRLRLPS